MVNCFGNRHCSSPLFRQRSFGQSRTLKERKSSTIGFMSACRTGMGESLVSRPKCDAESELRVGCSTELYLQDELRWIWSQMHLRKLSAHIGFPAMIACLWIKLWFSLGFRARDGSDLGRASERPSWIVNRRNNNIRSCPWNLVITRNFARTPKSSWCEIWRSLRESRVRNPNWLGESTFSRLASAPCRPSRAKIRNDNYWIPTWNAKIGPGLAICVPRQKTNG